MKENHKLMELGEKSWSYRKEFGFSKKLSEEIQREAAQICNSGVSAYAVGKVLGVPQNTVTEWARRFTEEKKSFAEVSVVSASEAPNFEICLSGVIQGCRVTVTGKDFSLLQRLLRKMGA